jgi:hypothetical protein
VQIIVKKQNHYAGLALFHKNVKIYKLSRKTATLGRIFLILVYPWD